MQVLNYNSNESLIIITVTFFIKEYYHHEKMIVSYHIISYIDSILTWLHQCLRDDIMCDNVTTYIPLLETTYLLTTYLVGRLSKSITAVIYLD